MIDIKEFKRTFYVFYNLIKDYKDVLLTTTNFEVEYIDNVYNINIKSYRPGLIIGKGGKDIEDYNKYIQKELNIKNFKINLTEENLWSDIF